jgi:large conductance mechanosensitive channel
VINFLLIALIVFTIVKLMNTAKDKMSKKPEEAPAAPTTKKCPYCMSEIDIHATRCPHCTSELSE